jgi:hypothetical protein
MMNQAADELHELLATYERHIRAGTKDAGVFCAIGRAFLRLGREQDARRCYKRAVELMLAAIRVGNVDLALRYEHDLYISFVRVVESEEHYYRRFSDWREELARLGRRFRDVSTGADSDPQKIAFILLTGHVLGHTSVLLKYLAARNIKRGANDNLIPTIYVIEGCSPPFVEACRAAGANLVSLEQDLPALAKAGLGQKLLALRDRLRDDRIACAVWVSIPLASAFALSAGMAPVQIFWALKFHPVAGPYIDGYLTNGSPGQTERKFGKQSWQVVPTPLAIEMRHVDQDEVMRIRKSFSEPFLFGTVAREEKIQSPDFLRAVVKILKAQPEAGYLWTGRNAARPIVDYFEAQGVASRCHFIGWVDPVLYASAFDVFLETFPFGCGITGYQALGARTALLSYLSEDTVFGMQYWSQVGNMSDADVTGFPVLCARNSEEYVNLAIRLASDSAFRGEVAARGHGFFQDELALGTSHAAAFFGAIKEIIASKLQRQAGMQS